MSLNLFGKGKGIGDTSQGSNLSQNSSNERSGKFPDISAFMTTEGYYANAIPGTQAHVDPGHIIYIKDISAKDTRINNRIMLILYHNQPFSYTCLSFCSHSELSSEGLRSSHALVYMDEGQQNAQQPNGSLPRLEIQLHQNNTSFSLKPNIYLNLRQPWNIEQEARFIILGRVETKSYLSLTPKIGKLFSESLMSPDIFSDSGNHSGSNQEEPAVSEKKNGRHKGKDSASKRKRSDGKHR